MNSPDVVAEIIRDRIRENTCHERNRKRRERFNAKRNLVNSEIEYKTKFREDDVKAAALALAKNSDREASMTVLKESFINDLTHIITFMKTEGALHALVRQLLSTTSFSGMESLLAMECCCNLSLGDSKTCFKLAKGVTPYLISVLQGFNHILMNVALLTLGNMSGSDKKTCELLNSQGLLKSFEHTIEIPELKEATVKAMILFTKNYLKEISEEESIRIVNTCLPYYETSTNIQWLIFHFSSLPYIKPLLIKNNLPERIIRYLETLTQLDPDNIVSVTAQIRTLAFLSTDPDGYTGKVILDDWDKTLHIIKFLIDNNYRHLSKEIFWLLANIIKHNSPEIKTKLANNVNDLHSICSYLPSNIIM